MRAAIVKNNVVVNIITIDDGYVGSAIKTFDLPVVIGDTYDGSNFYRAGEIVTEQTGLQAESDEISEEYAAAFDLLNTEAVDGEN